VTTHDHNVKSIFSNDRKSLEKKRCQRGNQKPLVKDGEPLVGIVLSVHLFHFGIVLSVHLFHFGIVLSIIQYQPEALKTDNTIPK
jgi:hypothetical protein